MARSGEGSTSRIRLKSKGGDMHECVLAFYEAVSEAIKANFKGTTWKQYT